MRRLPWEGRLGRGDVERSSRPRPGERIERPASMIGEPVGLFSRLGMDSVVFEFQPEKLLTALPAILCIQATIHLARLSRFGLGQ
jgi:hypothetical protein